MTVNLLVENDQIVEALQHAVHSGGVGLSCVPQLVKQVIDRRCYADRVVRATGERIGFPTFQEFVVKHPPEGLGADLRLVKRICADDPEAMDKIDQATVGSHGGDRKSDRIKRVNHPLDNEGGQDRSGKHIRRLRKDGGDLHTEVVAGRKGVTAAAIEAGIYPRRVSINLGSPDSAAATILRHADAEFVGNLADLLAKGVGDG